MSLKINSNCVFCGACELECPNRAISPGADTYTIDPARCTECVGAFDEPQCRLVCPADAIHPDTAHAETRAELQAKFKMLHG
jgi:ferredoxin